MLPSWPISLRESFDTTNPWVVRLTGLARGRSSFLGLPGFLALGVALFVVLGALASGTRDETTLLLIGGPAYLLLVALAFLAPAFGASTRNRIDGDPALAESLATPLPDRAYVAAMHGRIAMLSVCGFVVFGIAAGAVCLATLRVSSVHLPADSVVGFRRAVVIAILILSANYAAGILLHATLLANVCQKAPKARLKGGALTAVILIVMSALLVGRLAFYLMVLEAFSQGMKGLLVIPCVLDGLLGVTRLAWAHCLWARMLAHAMNETRPHLGLG
ncbi:MAG: hypothetical protein KF858_01665 [Candidatus Sumerlaeia bacterium]|nr:hypothetical protein [Candidatus Sumerlaeia bacterium]